MFCRMISPSPNINLSILIYPVNGPMSKTLGIRFGVKSTSHWGLKNIGGTLHKKYQEIFKLNSPVINL